MGRDRVKIYGQSRVKYFFIIAHHSSLGKEKQRVSEMRGLLETGLKKKR